MSFNHPHSPVGRKPGLGIPLEQGALAEDSLHPPATLLATPQGIWLHDTISPSKKFCRPLAPGTGGRRQSPLYHSCFPSSRPLHCLEGQKKKSMKIGLGRGTEISDRLSHLWSSSSSPLHTVWLGDICLLRPEASLIPPPWSLQRTTACNGSLCSSLCLWPALPQCQPKLLSLRGREGSPAGKHPGNWTLWFSSEMCPRVFTESSS